MPPIKSILTACALLASFAGGYWQVSLVATGWQITAGRRRSAKSAQTPQRTSRNYQNNTGRKSMNSLRMPKRWIKNTLKAYLLPSAVLMSLAILSLLALSGCSSVPNVQVEATRPAPPAAWAIDGFEWSASVNSLVDKSRGCPKCAGGNTPYPQAERERQINSKPNIEFVRWANGYKNQESKAVCKCLIDDYEWATSVAILIHHGSGCPRCAGRVSPPSEKVEGMINAKPNISFVRWADGYKNKGSKAICRCAVDDFEWPVSAYSLIDNGTGCPKCAKKGYDPSKRGTLYILRSECGSRVKIGISNDHKQRHRVLKRETPFNWHCIELLHSDDGSLIAELEKELHSWTEQAEFREPFDGYTEWRKWDDRIPMWIEEYRARA